MNKMLNKAPIKEQIYEIIKSNIIERKYQPGQRLSIMSISRELNVSNSPVREAISMLERDGLVENYPNVGPSVITLSDKKLAQIAQAILSMLLGALEVCSQSDKMDQLVGMLQHALKVQMDHQDSKDEQEYVEYSIAFEASIIQCCDNPYISNQYAEMRDLFYLTVLYDHWYIDTVRMQAVLEHQQILGSIMSGDLDAARIQLAKHYNRFEVR